MGNTGLRNTGLKDTGNAEMLAPVPLQTLKVDLLTVQIYESAADVALAGSVSAYQILRDAIEGNGGAVGIFATGRSQINFLAHLTRSNLNWSKITGFHLDEYLGISAEHPASFRHYLATHLTNKVAIGQWNPIAGDGLLPIDICQRYDQALKANAADLCCLGVGNNGHLAFNDPAVADFNDPSWVKLVKLDEQNRQQQAESTAFTSLESVPQYAFTLTLSAIRAARHSLCLAYGEGKASIVHQLLTGAVGTHCPASILREMPAAILLIDRAAANLVS